MTKGSGLKRKRNAPRAELGGRLTRMPGAVQYIILLENYADPA
jgi:hypothetical protein